MTCPGVARELGASERRNKRELPTWPGCPLLPPRFMLAPPPRFMFPLCAGPPRFMGPPLWPMLPLIGPDLGEPPRLGSGPPPPPPRLKLPRLWKPPLKGGGGRKPRGGRRKPPPRGPGAAGTHSTQWSVSAAGYTNK